MKATVRVLDSKGPNSQLIHPLAQCCCEIQQIKDPASHGRATVNFCRGNLLSGDLLSVSSATKGLLSLQTGPYSQLVLVLSGAGTNRTICWWQLCHLEYTLVSSHLYLDFCPLLSHLWFTLLISYRLARSSNLSSIIRSDDLWLSVPPVFAFSSFIYSDLWILKFPSSAQVQLILITFSGSKLGVPWLELLLHLPLYFPMGQGSPRAFNNYLSPYLPMWQDFTQSCNRKCTEGTEFLKNQSSTYPKLFLITANLSVSPSGKFSLKSHFSQWSMLRLILAVKSKTSSPFLRNIQSVDVQGQRKAI